MQRLGILLGERPLKKYNFLSPLMGLVKSLRELSTHGKNISNKTYALAKPSHKLISIHVHTWVFIHELILPRRS